MGPRARPTQEPQPHLCSGDNMTELGEGPKRPVRGLCGHGTLRGDMIKSPDLSLITATAPGGWIAKGISLARQCQVTLPDVAMPFILVLKLVNAAAWNPKYPSHCVGSNFWVCSHGCCCPARTGG